MTKYEMTIGMNDKDTEMQMINTVDAKNIIADILINKYNVFAFTMIDCNGVYKMSSSGNIVNEESVRIEIVTDESTLDIIGIIIDLKEALNQESIMLEMTENTMISFI